MKVGINFGNFKEVSSFKERLKEAMEMADIKQTDLSTAIGVTASTISQYLAGETQPKIGNLLLIAEQLKVSPLWLLGLNVSSEAKKTPVNFDAIQEAYSKFLDVMAYEFDGDVPEDIRRMATYIGILIYSERIHGWHKKGKYK